MQSGQVFLHVQDGPTVVGPTEPGWWSAMWDLEAQSDGAVRFRNRWRESVYVHANGGQIEAFAPPGNAYVTQWILIPQGQNTGAQRLFAMIGVDGMRTFAGNASQPVPPGPAAPSARQTTGAPPSDVFWALANAPRRMIYVQNFSNNPAELYLDVGGALERVTDLPPRYQIEQQSPVGARWRLKVNNQWVDDYVVSHDVDQQWRYPDSP